MTQSHVLGQESANQQTKRLGAGHLVLCVAVSLPHLRHNHNPSAGVERRSIYMKPSTWPPDLLQRSSHGSDLVNGTSVATLPGALSSKVSAGTGWPGVSAL